jgi:hypothetical protein
MLAWYTEGGVSQGRSCTCRSLPRAARRPPLAPYPPIAAARRPRQGHTSDCAENGVEAVGACASQRYDLILMVSPGRDGGAAGGLGR